MSRGDIRKISKENWQIGRFLHIVCLEEFINDCVMFVLGAFSLTPIVLLSLSGGTSYLNFLQNTIWDLLDEIPLDVVSAMMVLQDIFRLSIENIYIKLFHILQDRLIFDHFFFKIKTVFYPSKPRASLLGVLIGYCVLKFHIEVQPQYVLSEFGFL